MILDQRYINYQQHVPQGTVVVSTHFSESTDFQATSSYVYAIESLHSYDTTLDNRQGSLSSRSVMELLEDHTEPDDDTQKCQQLLSEYEFSSEVSEIHWNSSIQMGPCTSSVLESL